MGRRSTSTTKSGKYMNPADQARKEARRKELKKNKQQRQAVRQAVLKARHPTDLIFEMEKVDAIEYDTEGEPKLHVKVLQEKRKKLMEMFSKVMKMYEKESPDQYLEYRKAFQDYERRRHDMEEYCKSVRIASEVMPSDIPLPDIAQASDVYTASQFSNTDEIPLPDFLIAKKDKEERPLHSILKRKEEKEKAKQEARVRNPPGPPPGEPPELSDSEAESDSEDAPPGDKKGSRVRFDAEATDDDKDSRTFYKRRIRGVELLDDVPEEPEQHGIGPTPAPFGARMVRNVALRPPPGTIPGPPSMRPPLFLPGVPGGAGPRRVPPPPPGIPPPRMLRPPPGMAPSGPGGMNPPGVVLSAPPSLHIRPSEQSGAANRPSEGDEPSAPGTAPQSAGPAKRPRATDATIEAKPQIRNRQADLMRLVPTAVKLHRNPAAPHTPRRSERESTSAVFGRQADYSAQPKVQERTKDDAYDQFMKEMQGLI